MYGLWYLFFGFLVLVIVSLVLALVFGLCEKRWDKKRFDTELERAEIGVSLYSIEEKENRKKYRELTNKIEYQREKASNFEDAKVPCFISATGWGVIALIMLLASLCMPIGVKSEIATFNYNKQFVELAIENGDELENIAITQTVIEQNKWLAEAKADLETYGRFSQYYNSGIMELEPITINREKK